MAGFPFLSCLFPFSFHLIKKKKNNKEIFSCVRCAQYAKIIISLHSQKLVDKWPKSFMKIEDEFIFDIVIPVCINNEVASMIF